MASRLAAARVRAGALLDPGAFFVLAALDAKISKQVQL
jgi:hypothetical protein